MTTTDILVAGAGCLVAITGWYVGTRKSRVEENSHLVTGYKDLNEQYKGEIGRLTEDQRQTKIAVEKLIEQVDTLERSEKNCKRELGEVREQYTELKGQYEYLLNHYKSIRDSNGPNQRY